MKLSFLGVGVGCVALALSVQTEFAQTPQMVKVLGCLQGDGSEQKPWIIAGVAIPPPAAAPAGGGGGGGGRGGGGGGRGAGAPAGGAPQAGAAAAGGAGRGAPGGAAAAPGAGAAAGAPAGAGAAPGGQGRGGAGAAGGRGGGRGGAVPAVPAPPVQLVDLRPTGGLNLMPWRGMKIEVEGTLGAKPASGPQEINLTSARSVQGVCTPK